MPKLLKANAILAGVMELADVADSKSAGLNTRAGSSPATGTKTLLEKIK